MSRYILFCLMFLVQCAFAENIAVIPRPVSLKTLPDAGFTLNEKSIIVYSDQTAKRPAEMLAEYLRPATGFGLPVRNGSTGTIVFEKVNNLDLGKEGYELLVTDYARISASDAAGFFYGAQTFRQLLPPEIVATQKVDGVMWMVPGVTISDRPRFPWRAFMLDEARYFKGEKVVKFLLDQMAMLKMNIFHWHLVDDQGWRIEIKKYPRLTEIGSKRRETQIGGWKSKAYDGVPHEGYYTQEQIREIVQYAADRQITIVPEIEMPGHASAAIAAYPELGTKQEPIEVPTRFGKHKNCFNAADENVYRMINEILDEVVALFPSKVIHIGGDEVQFNHWKESRQIAEFMKREGLKTFADVQAYFTNRISRDIEKKGRRMMGWNEILGDDLHGINRDHQSSSSISLSSNAIIHFWKGSPELAERALRSGHDIVNSWHRYTYLDYGYGSISLQKAYGFDPIFEGLAREYWDHVLGLGCQMWGEWIPTVESMEKKVFPRIAAYAEVGWTPLERKDYADFKKRMEVQYKRWDQLGIHYTKIISRKGKSDMKRKDFIHYRKIGEWTPSIVPVDWQEVAFKTKKFIDKSGTVNVAMIYIKGRHGIDIQWIALCENGREISRDTHDGFSGNKLYNVIYKLNVPEFKPTATYTLKARIKGSAGTDSTGEIKLYVSSNH